MPLGYIRFSSTAAFQNSIPFFERPREETIQAYNATVFKAEWNDYIAIKARENKWWRITWYDDKKRFGEEMFRMIDAHTAHPTNETKTAVMQKIREGVTAFAGINTHEHSTDSAFSEMSRMLMKWYRRIEAHSPAAATIAADTAAAVAPPAPGTITRRSPFSVGG